MAFRQSLGLSPRRLTSTASLQQHSWRDILHRFTNKRFLKLFCKCATTDCNGVLVFDCACDVSNVGIIRCGCPGVFQHSPYISADACFSLPTLKSANSWRNERLAIFIREKNAVSSAWHHFKTSDSFFSFRPPFVFQISDVWMFGNPWHSADHVFGSDWRLIWWWAFHSEFVPTHTFFLAGVLHVPPDVICSYFVYKLLYHYPILTNMVLVWWEMTDIWFIKIIYT